MADLSFSALIGAMCIVVLILVIVDYGGSYYGLHGKKNTLVGFNPCYSGLWRIRLVFSVLLKYVQFCQRTHVVEIEAVITGSQQFFANVWIIPIKNNCVVSHVIARSATTWQSL